MMTILKKFCGKRKILASEVIYVKHGLNNPNEWYVPNKRGFRK